MTSWRGKGAIASVIGGKPWVVESRRACGELVLVVNVAGRELAFGRCLALVLLWRPHYPTSRSRTLFLLTCCPLRAFYAAVHSARRPSYRPCAISRLSEVVVARTDTLD